MFTTYRSLFQRNEWTFSFSEEGLRKLSEISEINAQSNYRVHISGGNLIVVKDGMFKGVLYKPVFYGKINSADNIINGYFSRSRLAKYLRGSWYTFILMLLVFSLPVTFISMLMGGVGSILIPALCGILLYASDRFFVKYQPNYDDEINSIKMFVSRTCG